MTLSTIRIGFLFAAIAAAAPAAGNAPPPTPTGRYHMESISGWQVRFHPDLMADADLHPRVRRAISGRLNHFSEIVPAGPLAKLRTIPIWIELHDPHGFGACFHEDREWLVANDINPDKTGGVEISNARDFVDHWEKDEPMVVLHELAHAYHHLYLGADHPGILQCYEKAKQTGSYNSVLRISGNREQAYAMENPKEYFAELTEAFFGMNDYFPFVRAELKEHDLEMFRLLEKLWSNNAATSVKR